MFGTISHLRTDRGYGFVIRDGGGMSYFMHASSLETGAFETLTIGQRIEFDVASENLRGPRALRVRVIEEPVAFEAIA